jgi:hypothetical protein
MSIYQKLEENVDMYIKWLLKRKHCFPVDEVPQIMPNSRTETKYSLYSSEIRSGLI